MEKDPPVKSTVSMGIGCISRADYNDNNAFYQHHHDVLEILCVTSGKIIVTVDKTEYLLKKGDVVIVNPFKIHFGKWVEQSDAEYYCYTCNLKSLLGFHTSVLEKCQKQLLEGTLQFDVYHNSQSESAKFILDILTKTHTEFGKKTPSSECLCVGYTYMLCAYLFDNCCKESDAPDTSRDVEFIKQVSVYMNDNYTNNISTSHIAKHFYMTTSRFCSVFQKNFGLSFLNYLCYFRIIRASEMYFNKGMSLYDIAYKVGFSDYNYFSKMFKKYMGVTPSKYYGKTK